MNGYREFKTIGKDSKKGKYYIDAYEASTASELYDVYGRYSADKAEAFEECCNIAAQYEANSSRRIVKAGRTYFTFAFKADDGLHVLTAKYHYIVK